MPYVMPFLLAMVVTMAWLPVFGRMATKWMILDAPAARKVHTTPIPRVGGVAMVIGVMVAAVITIPLETPDRYFLLAASVLALFGLLDDRFDLDYRIKLIGQLLAVGIVIFGGDIRIQSITLEDRVMLPAWISVPVTALFLVGITNAINLADGLDGLAGGTTFLCLAALAMLAYVGGQPVCAALALAFAGSVLGFLRFNTYPASVFMGDAGSQLLGFAVGVLSLRATQAGESAVSAATPVLLLALPILDTLSVMVQRISEGRSPFSADRNHIHHKLLQLGFNHHEAVMVIYMIQADLFLLAYWLRFESDLTILAVVSVFFLLTIGAFQYAQRYGWRFRAINESQLESPLVRVITTLRQREHLPRWSYAGVAIGVGLYGILVVEETAAPSGDVRLLVSALLALTVVLLCVFRTRPLNIVEKGAAYVTTTVLVYLDSLMQPTWGPLSYVCWGAVGLAAVCTVMRLQIATDRRFVLTPLDLIVLFVALVIPSLPDSIGLPYGGAAGIAKLVVLFYAIEVLVNRAELGVVWLRIALVGLLSGLVVRPILLF